MNQKAMMSLSIRTSGGFKMRFLFLSQMETELTELEKRIQMLKQIEAKLNSLNTEGFEYEVTEIKSKLKNPNSVSEVGREFELLKRRIYEKKEEERRLREEEKRRKEKERIADEVRRRQEERRKKEREREEIEDLINETDSIIEKAIHDATDANDAMWLVALKILQLQFFNFSEDFKNDKFSYNSAMSSILDLKEQAEILRTSPHEEEIPKKHTKKISLEERAYIAIGVDPNADSYQILEIDHNASEEKVQKAYHAKVNAWHPDRFKTKKDNELVEEVTKILNIAKDKIYKEKGWT